MLKICRGLELDINADRIWKTTGKQLNLLQLGEITGVCQMLLKRLLIIFDRIAASEASKIREVVCTQGWPKSLLAQGAEKRPADGVDVTSITHQHVEPVLRYPRQMEGSDFQLVVVTSVLSAEEMFTSRANRGDPPRRRRWETTTSGKQVAAYGLGSPEVLLVELEWQMESGEKGFGGLGATGRR